MNSTARRESGPTQKALPHESHAQSSVTSAASRTQRGSFSSAATASGGTRVPTTPLQAAQRESSLSGSKASPKRDRTAASC